MPRPDAQPVISSDHYDRSVKSGIRLTIGACFNKIPGTLGIGLQPGPACDLIYDALFLDKYFFPKSVCEIFSFDMIEHVPTKKVLPMFRVWHKILSENGRLEIGTLDLLSTCRDFISSDGARRKLLINHFYGGQTFPSDFHLTGYTYDILKDYLKDAGFVKIRKFDSLYKKWCANLIVEAFK